MKLRDYLAGKAVVLLGFCIFAILWGVFAFFMGANAVLLWGSEGAFAFAVVLRYSIGYARARKRIKKLCAQRDGLDDKYLLGELVQKPTDATEREYYEVMRTVSAAAIGAVESARREKEEYCEYVEQWIHEIKTPLTACTLICDNGADAVKLKRELKRADNMTESILYYARLRAPERDTVIAKTSAQKIIGDAITSQRELLIAAKIGLETHGDFSVDTDGKAVGFIIKQLLINCAKYCRGCHVKIVAENGVITVEDDGAGIAPHELPRITARGYTGALGRQAGSTGMGLYIVAETCKRLNIELSVSSKQGVGTTFALDFNGVKSAPRKT